MTYAVYDLTDSTQLSIRGTTGTHPDSKFVFGICMSDGEAYDDMDWSEAVRMARWILEQDKWIRKSGCDSDCYPENQ